MTFRKEFGVSELISLLAFILSGFAFLYSTKANDAYIVGGGGIVSYTTVQQGNQCSFVMTIPVDFHNSGKEAVTLKQLAPPVDVNSMLFSDNNEILATKDINYHMYLSSSNIISPSVFWITQFKNREEFEPTYNHINDLIEPGQRYGFYVVIIVDSVNELRKYSDLSSFFSMRAIFSNNQEIPINSAIKIDTQALKECG